MPTASGGDGGNDAATDGATGDAGVEGGCSIAQPYADPYCANAPATCVNASGITCINVSTCPGGQGYMECGNQQDCNFPDAGGGCCIALNVTFDAGCPGVAGVVAYNNANAFTHCGIGCSLTACARDSECTPPAKCYPMAFGQQNLGVCQ